MINVIRQDKKCYSKALRRSAEQYLIKCFAEASPEYIEVAMHIITGREYVPMTAVVDDSIKLNKFDIEEQRHDMGRLPDYGGIYTE